MNNLIDFTSQDFQNLSTVVRALDSYQRNQLLVKIQEKPNLRVTDLAAIMDKEPGLIHGNLKQMEKAGLIKMSKTGRTVLVIPDQDNIAKFKDLVDTFSNYQIPTP